eukprot:gene34820-42169_t
MDSSAFNSGDMERELLQELAQLDSIFGDGLNAATSTKPISSRLRGTLSTYEIAAAESEREELQDSLRILLSKTEDFDAQLRQVNAENFAIRSANEQLRRENLTLRQMLVDQEKELEGQRGRSGVGGEVGEDFRLLEFKLAETRSKLARAQQVFEDCHLAKEQALRELEAERQRRIHVEKERDAYSAAYEASLQHFERWSRHKASNGGEGLTGAK